MESLLRAASGPASPAARQRHKHGKNFRRNTLVALAICLIILGFASSPVTLAQLIPIPFASACLCICSFCKVCRVDCRAITRLLVQRRSCDSLQDQSARQRYLTCNAYSACTAFSDLPPARSVSSSALFVQDVLQKMQHHTLTVEECTGSKCTTEVVNVHDTAMLVEQQLPKDIIQSQTEIALNASDSRLGLVSIQKRVGKPLVVTVKRDDSDPGQQVQSGGALLTDEAKDRVALLNQAASQQRLTEANPALAQRAVEIADELSNHNAAAHHEGDNILEIHRDDIGLSSKPVDPATLSNLTHISDDNNLQIMQDTNSASLLSGFNSEKARAEVQEQQSDASAGTSAVRVGTAQ